MPAMPTLSRLGLFYSSPLGLALGLTMATSVSWAQTESKALAPPAELHLSASAHTEVPQDWLVLSLAVQTQAPQAAVVQQQLTAALRAAVAEAIASVKPGHLELSTGGLQVSPRFGREGKINGWQGSAHLVLQGRDAAAIAAVAARLPGMTVTGIEWTLSEAQKKAAETRIQAQAVDNFKNQAQTLTRQFGFARYVLRQVRVGTPEAGNGFEPRMAMVQRNAQMDNPSPQPVPTLAGTAKVVVTITGSIQLQ